jgi:Na+/melibiose symporter-like transporter
VAILAAAILVAAGRINLALLILVVLVNAGGRAVYYSSLQAMVPELVGPDALERANGVLTGTEAGTEYLAGPVVGTSLFAVAKALPFFADAIALVASCLPFVRFPSKASAPAEASTSVWEGARLLFADRRLRIVLLMVALLALFQGMEGGVLVLLATTVWGVREGAYGLFLAATAVGNLLGSALADSQVRRFGSARTLLGAAVLSGVGYLIMASAHSWVLAAPAFALVGVAVAVISVVAISLRQRLTPPHLMGRVGGAWRGIVWGAAPVGALVAGSVATIGGLRLPLVMAGALQCVVAIVFARPLLRSTRDDGPRLEPNGDQANPVVLPTTSQSPPANQVDEEG